MPPPADSRRLSSPSRARAQFGNRLRRLREDADLNGKQLAERVGWAASKVSRLETGQRTASREDVTAWVEAVGASAEVLAELLEAHRVMRVEYDRWHLRLRRGHGPRQRAALGLEATTTRLRAFEPDIVPGLLQTAEYARHVLTGLAQLRQTPNDIEEAVRVRMRRQEVLYEPGRDFRFLLTEAALHYRFCPLAVLRGQLDRLVTLAGLDTIEVGVIPFTADLPVVLHNAFWLYEDHLVLVETYSAELALRDPDDVLLYDRVFDLLWAAADRGEAAVSTMRRAMETSSQSLGRLDTERANNASPGVQPAPR